MEIIGYDLLPFKPHYAVESKEELGATPANATVHLKRFDGELMRYLAQNAVCYSVVVKSVHELILANALGAAYILTTDPYRDQPIAQNYLFDAKLLVLIEDIAQIDTLAKSNIDGVIFPGAILESY